jgi:hypothetical protein
MSTQVQYTMQNLRQLFKNVPSIIDMSRLEKITDRSFLASLEYDYQQFLETNLQLLDLYNFIDYLLDIRDAILLKLNRLRREEQIRKYKEEQVSSINTIKPNVLIEYKCGCQNFVYYNSIKRNNNFHHHCTRHLRMVKTQRNLTNELTIINNELESIPSSENVKSINYYNDNVNEYNNE